MLYTSAIAVFSCITAGVCAQNQSAVLKDQFAAYNQQVLQEKVYVHTDKNFYLAGEICWFKIYNTDAFFNKPLGVSKVAYVEVLDKNNKPVLQSKIALENGDGDGSLQWPGSLLSGKYKLRAYTNWMKNFNKAYFLKRQSQSSTRAKYMMLVCRSKSRCTTYNFFLKAETWLWGWKVKLPLK